jgi:hypothetical protein
VVGVCGFDGNVDFHSEVCILYVKRFTASLMSAVVFSRTSFCRINS